MLYQFLLYNNVSQPYVYLSPFPPESPSRPSRSSQSTELSFLSYTTGSSQLSALHVVVYICQFIQPSPSLLCPQIHSLCWCLCSCPAGSFLMFLDFNDIRNPSFSLQVTLGKTQLRPKLCSLGFVKYLMAASFSSVQSLVCLYQIKGFIISLS